MEVMPIRIANCLLLLFFFFLLSTDACSTGGGDQCVLRTADRRGDHGEHHRTQRVAVGDHDGQGVHCQKAHQNIVLSSSSRQSARRSSRRPARRNCRSVAGHRTGVRRQQREDQQSIIVEPTTGADTAFWPKFEVVTTVGGRHNFIDSLQRSG